MRKHDGYALLSFLCTRMNRRNFFWANLCILDNICPHSSNQQHGNWRIRKCMWKPGKLQGSKSAAVRHWKDQQHAVCIDNICGSNDSILTKRNSTGLFSWRVKTDSKKAFLQTLTVNLDGFSSITLQVHPFFPAKNMSKVQRYITHQADLLGLFVHFYHPTFSRASFYPLLVHPPQKGQEKGCDAAFSQSKPKQPNPAWIRKPKKTNIFFFPFSFFFFEQTCLDNSLLQQSHAYGLHTEIRKQNNWRSSIHNDKHHSHTKQHGCRCHATPRRTLRQPDDAQNDPCQNENTRKHKQQSSSLWERSAKKKECYSPWDRQDGSNDNESIERCCARVIPTSIEQHNTSKDERCCDTHQTPQAKLDDWQMQICSIFRKPDFGRKETRPSKKPVQTYQNTIPPHEKLVVLVGNCVEIVLVFHGHLRLNFLFPLPFKKREILRFFFFFFFFSRTLTGRPAMHFDAPERRERLNPSAKLSFF